MIYSLRSTIRALSGFAMLAVWLSCNPSKGDEAKADIQLTAQVGTVDVRIFVPRQADAVRGLILHAANYKLKDDDRWAELCRQLHFAHIAMNIPDVQKATSRGQKLSQGLEEGLKQFAEKSGHAELMTAPRVGVGHSAGGLVTQVLLRDPARTITNCVDCGWVLDSTALKAEAASVPALFTMGAVPDDFKMLPSISEKYEPARRAGLPWGLGVQWDCAHDFGNSAALAIPWIQAICDARLPKTASGKADAVTLRDLKLEDGWLGDRTTIDSQLPVIAAWNHYASDKSVAAWFPNRAVAHVWRAWQSHNSPVTLEAVTADGKHKLPALKPKEARDLVMPADLDLVLQVSIAEDVRLAKVEYFDADVAVGEGRGSDGWRFTWKSPAQGIHCVYAQWETAEGKRGVTNPALAIVQTK